MPVECQGHLEVLQGLSELLLLEACSPNAIPRCVVAQVMPQSPLEGSDGLAGLSQGHPLQALQGSNGVGQMP